MQQAFAKRLAAQRPSVSSLWHTLENVPGGPAVFSKVIGMLAPYTGTIGARVKTLSHGHAEVELRDRRAVRNHLDSVHAIALMNLGEVATGLAMLYSVDGQGRGIIKKLEMEYLRKARGTITATCDAAIPARSGSHDVHLEALLRDKDGEVVAVARAIWKITLN